MKTTFFTLAGSKEIRRFKSFNLFFRLVHLIVPSILMTIFIFDTRLEKEHRLETMEDIAFAIFRQDADYMTSLAAWGGVYVQVTGKVKPDPFLANQSERDLTSTSGKILTLVHPSFLSNTSVDSTQVVSDIKRKFTSLRPLDPSHSPDRWEALAMQRFESSSDSTREVIDTLDGKHVFRYIRIRDGCRTPPGACARIP